jgi:hypothetical protein
MEWELRKTRKKRRVLPPRMRTMRMTMKTRTRMRRMRRTKTKMRTRRMKRREVSWLFDVPPRAPADDFVGERQRKVCVDSACSSWEVFRLTEEQRRRKHKKKYRFLDVEAEVDDEDEEEDEADDFGARIMCARSDQSV